jgi:hypothetical protein
MADFDLGRRFGLVYVADNSFRELPTRRQLLSCLRCIRRHLRPSGYLLISERRLDPTLVVQGRRSFGWSRPMIDPRTGRRVSRRGEVRLSRDHKRVGGVFVYRTTSPNGRTETDACRWEGPALHTDEYLSLFAKAGLTARAYAGYCDEADDGHSRMLCFVCRPSA